MKRAVLFQLRPEDEASDGEYAAFLEKGGLAADQLVRVRLDAGAMPDDLRLADFDAVIVGGGPGCVSDDPETRDPIEARAEAELLMLMPQIVDRDMPFLGCCYGLGLLAHYLGGQVSKERYGEPVSAVPCDLTEAGRADPLLEELPQRFDALVGHKEAVQELPPGAVHLVSSPDCPYQMIRVGQNVYATQFHPEADGQVFADRIRIYRDRGYFRPEEADALSAKMLASDVQEPVHILRRFVVRYLQGPQS